MTHTLEIPIPSFDDIESLNSLVGVDTVLVFTYPAYNSALLFGQDAKLLAAITGTNNRLSHGYDQSANPITYYSIECRWAILNGNELVKLLGFCVCIVPN